MKPAIVYLAQNTPSDPQYGRDRRSILNKSLDQLFENYNNKFLHDVLIFHEGDFTPADQATIIRGRPQISFKEIHFQIPGFLPSEEVPEKIRMWRMGHRHMIRFYSVQVWDLLAEMGYDWMMRMDDDSFIHSIIDYDLFTFMDRNDYEYGYRIDVEEGTISAPGFGDAVTAYINAEKLRPSFWGEHLKPAPVTTHAKNLAKALIMKANQRKKHILEPSSQYDLWGYYNNFYIAKLAFWKSRQVQSFIRHFDRISGWYKYRWNDLIFQSAALQVFMPKSKIYKFTDWTYEHATLRDGRLDFGGIFEGSADQNSEAVTQFRARFGTTCFPPGRFR
jgi:Glycolipid 2-alpha-mannosyltransferase